MTTFLGVLTFVVALTTDAAPRQETPKQVQPPPHQVMVLYFHRTQRCPTCKRIGALGEAAITKGFPSELKSKTVEYRLVDFHNKKNTKLASQYKIKGPTLVLLNVFDGKVVSWTPMPKVWQLVGKPEAFHAYVRDGVAKYLKQTRKEAESKE